MYPPCHIDHEVGVQWKAAGVQSTALHPQCIPAPKAGVQLLEGVTDLWVRQLWRDPDLALDPVTSARILIEGITRGVSVRGDFTGRALEDFIAGDRCDYVGARRTVNGTDRANDIAGYAKRFEAALVAGGMPLTAARMPGALGTPPPAPPPAPSSPPKLPSQPALTGGLSSAAAPAPSRTLFQRVADRLRAAYPVKG